MTKMRFAGACRGIQRIDSFTREAILANAPPASGVYGLFNFDCQVFIGESANIQEALLHHESETDFHSKHLRPTGFTFEACAAGLRKSKADALIARFRPMLQTKAALTETCSLSSGPLVNPVARRGNESETCADHQEFPVHEDEERPTSRRPFHTGPGVFRWSRCLSRARWSSLILAYPPTKETNRALATVGRLWHDPRLPSHPYWMGALSVRQGGNCLRCTWLAAE